MREVQEISCCAATLLCFARLLRTSFWMAKFSCARRPNALAAYSIDFPLPSSASSALTPPDLWTSSWPFLLHARLPIL